MCGIYGYLGENAISKTIQGLEKLEYRGYDSAGIAYITKEGKISIEKAVGKVENLKAKINQNCFSNLSIAHTRWATHGKPTIENCHPHSSKNFCLVHNGIIENYVEIKKELKCKFNSQTDSEIIVQEIENKFNKKLKKTEKINENILNIIKNIQKKLKGSWAVELICKKIPNKIYVFKKSSPLIVASNGVNSAISSDINAINMSNDLQWNCCVLEDENIAEIYNNKIIIYDKNLNKIKLNNVKKNNFTEINNEKFTHKMLKEINDIPTAINNTKKTIKTSKFDEFIKNFNNYSKITIVGCGTAFHAGLYGKFIFEKYTKKQVNVELASEFRYKTNLCKKEDLVIAISQSGETADTIAAIKIANESGATTAVITNVSTSSITSICDFVFLTNAGPEIAVAATKSYVCQVYVLYKIACELSKLKEELDLENKAKQIINNFDEKFLRPYFKCEKFFFIGRLCDSATALEGALKLKEIAYCHSEGYAAGELKHGTLSLIDENTVVFAIITQSNIKEKTLNAVSEIEARGGKVVIISQFDFAGKSCIMLPNINEDVMPILSIIPLQLFSYYVSCSKGLNPDMPRNLAKSVTVE